MRAYGLAGGAVGFVSFEFGIEVGEGSDVCLVGTLVFGGGVCLLVSGDLEGTA